MARQAPLIVVYGATGTAGRLVARRLVESGARVAIAGRHQDRLDAMATELGGLEVRGGEVGNAVAMNALCEDAKVVVNCAGPFARLGAPVVDASIHAGAHYLDLAGEQAYLRDVYQRFESAARHANVAAVPGMAFSPAIGDLAAAWAARALAEGRAPSEGGPPVVTARSQDRIGDDAPFDEITVSYAFDHLTASTSTIQAILGSVLAPQVLWIRDRWDTATPSPPRSVNAGPELGRDRMCVSCPAGEIITIPRHATAQRVEGFISLTQSPWAMRAADVLGRLTPLFSGTTLGNTLSSALSQIELGIPPSADAQARTRFAVVASAKRGFEQVSLRVRGADPYGTTAAIVAWAARHLAERERGPVGVLAPSEVFAAAPSLSALTIAAGLSLDASFPRVQS